MKEYEVVFNQPCLVKFRYKVEADSAEDAIKLIRAGHYWDQDFDDIAPMYEDKEEYWNSSALISIEEEN